MGVHVSVYLSVCVSVVFLFVCSVCVLNSSSMHVHAVARLLITFGRRERREIMQGIAPGGGGV